MNKDLNDFIEQKLKEIEGKKDRPFGDLWNVTFFLEDEELVSLKIFPAGIDKLIEQIGDGHFISLEHGNTKTLINTNKIIHVSIKEEELLV